MYIKLKIWNKTKRSSSTLKRAKIRSAGRSTCTRKTFGLEEKRRQQPNCIIMHTREMRRRTIKSETHSQSSVQSVQRLLGIWEHIHNVLVPPRPPPQPRRNTCSSVCPLSAGAMLASHQLVAVLQFCSASINSNSLDLLGSQSSTAIL